MSDLDQIRIDDFGDGSELSCIAHPKWWADASGPLSVVVGRVTQHLHSAHRVHVAGCACQDQVTDCRCLPRVEWGAR